MLKSLSIGKGCVGDPRHWVDHGTQEAVLRGVVLRVIVACRGGGASLTMVFLVNALWQSAASNQM